MTPRSKRLAWELLRVLTKYSERDVDDALRMLTTGSLFETPAKLADQLAKAARRPRNNTSRKDSLPPGRRLTDVELERAYRIIDSHNVADREALKDFVGGVATGRYLKGTRLLRDFAYNLDLEFPTKLPSRSTVALAMINKLTRLDTSKRRELIEAGQRIDDSSALKAWSDLIVR